MAARAAARSLGNARIFFPRIGVVRSNARARASSPPRSRFRAAALLEQAQDKMRRPGAFDIRPFA
jgi:hypothetical protein